VRIVKTIGDKVISKSRFYNTFNYVLALIFNLSVS